MINAISSIPRRTKWHKNAMRTGRDHTTLFEGFSISTKKNVCRIFWHGRIQNSLVNRTCVSTFGWISWCPKFWSLNFPPRYFFRKLKKLLKTCKPHSFDDLFALESKLDLLASLPHHGRFCSTRGWATRSIVEFLYLSFFQFKISLLQLPT